MLISIQSDSCDVRDQATAAKGAASPASKLPDVPGYRLEEQLGSGVIGDVYRAVHATSGDAAAVKLIRTSRTDARQPMLQFIRQMSRLSDLHEFDLQRRWQALLH